MTQLLAEMNNNYAKLNVIVKEVKEKDEIRSTQGNAIASLKEIKGEARDVQKHLKAEKKSPPRKIYVQSKCKSRKDDGQDGLSVRRNEDLSRKGVGHGFGVKSRKINPDS
jgi:hypothetical protein